MTEGSPRRSSAVAAGANSAGDVANLSKASPMRIFSGPKSSRHPDQQRGRRARRGVRTFSAELGLPAPSNSSTILRSSATPSQSKKP